LKVANWSRSFGFVGLAELSKEASRNARRCGSALALGFVLMLLGVSRGNAYSGIEVLTPSRPTLDWEFEFTAGQRIFSAVTFPDLATPVDLIVIDPKGNVILERRGPTGADLLLTVPKTGNYRIHVSGDAVPSPVSVRFVIRDLTMNGR
jgi:hypothetical protein